MRKLVYKLLAIAVPIYGLCCASLIMNKAHEIAAYFPSGWVYVPYCAVSVEILMIAFIVSFYCMVEAKHGD